jgi:hypothetical protein
MPGGLGAFAILVAAIVLVLAFTFVWLLSRDKDVGRTSFGFYVERTRRDEPEVVPVSEKITKVEWPKAAEPIDP